ncbi:hypothetical protein IMSHALPRED_007665 [Imshaugia aleurites]|uniref:Uncharacterized protein n=1 Tax=Imshaugia aleurites TaxID=172621 RepID=A0A8H3FW61_9LECA|nr:hypothetical protein IMSHALPRED_007665 [Imshaugia aleurites]
MMQHTALILGLAAVFDLASANPRPVPGRSVAGETGCGAYGIYCNTPDTFSLCVPTVSGTEYYYFGSVAQGTYCDESQERIRADNYGDCSPNGQIFCGEDGLTFFECDQGGLISFGATAAGTECIDGQIVACNGVCGTDDGGPTTTVDPGDTTPSTIIVTSTTTPIITTITPTTSSTSSSTSSAAAPSVTSTLGYYAAPADGNLLGGPVFTSASMTEALCGTECTGRYMQLR